MAQEGIIKFNYELTPAKLIGSQFVKDINQCRSNLIKYGLIGVNQAGESYGNISVRFNQNEFIITASQTGSYQTLESQQLVVIKKCIFEDNKVLAAGEFKPSSESLTHGAVYSSDRRIKAVIHVHSLFLWQHLLNNHFPSTPQSAQYGSLELANAIIELFKDSRVFSQKIFVMAGHREGVVSFVKNLTEAENSILKFLK